MNESTKVILLMGVYAALIIGAIVFRISLKIKDKKHKEL